MATEHPASRRRRWAVLRSVRARIMGWVLLLVTSGMVVAGVAVFLVQTARIEDRIRAVVAQEIEEFETLHGEGRDPETGQPFASLERLFVLALQRNVPDEHESLLAVVDGRVRYHSADRNAAVIRNDPALLGAVASVVGSDRAGYRRISTPAGDVQLAVKPVLQGEREGAWVVAYFVAGEHREFADVMRTYALVAAASVLLVGVVGWFIAGQLLAPVRELRRASQQISESDLTRRIHVAGDDDVSDLGRTFNAMLDRLEEAFRTQREFLDNAGHELRTPLTIVRGHLELLDGASGAEFDTTKRLVLDELDRMARMVDELITLAKAERPDFLRPGPVDIGRLVDAVFDKAHSLGDRAWCVDERPDATTVADEQRLTQALVQLLANAVAVTGPGDTVALGARGDPESRAVLLWVRDTGPGVPPDDAAAIFERFRRGAAGGRSESSGLGLAIVKAIAEAHGGRVELRSTPGAGATFTLVIPWVRVRQPEGVLST